MSAREDLTRIGQEGFAAIDKVYGRSTHGQGRHKFPFSGYRRTKVVSRRTPIYQQAAQEEDVGYGWGRRPASKEEEEASAMDQKTAAGRFGGIMDVKYYGNWFGGI